jgi:hypothetical protein
LKNKFSLSKKNKFLWLVRLQNKTLIKSLRDGLLVLPASFVIEIEGVPTEKLWENIIATGKIHNNELVGFDFLICDNDINNLDKFLSYWVVPIILQDNILGSLLTEFNPMKNEWNSYIFKNLDKWSIFYAVIRYLENSKFPFDNENLVKNVLKI